MVARALIKPANLIGDLCAQFYKLGWVTGTGGGISIRQGSHVFLAPSGVQKERIRPEHVFVLPYPQAAVPTPGSTREFLRVPTTKGLKESACTPLFWNAFRMRDAGACIHTHSQHAGQFHPVPAADWGAALRQCTFLETDILSSISANDHTLSHGHAALARQRVHNLASGGECGDPRVRVALLPRTHPFTLRPPQMIKGIRRGGTGKTLTFLDTLTIPIIENTPDEEDLTDSMAEAMERYPEAGAVLVRRHGVYIWGPFGVSRVERWVVSKAESQLAPFVCRLDMGAGQDAGRVLRLPLRGQSLHNWL